MRCNKKGTLGNVPWDLRFQAALLRELNGVVCQVVIRSLAIGKHLQREGKIGVIGKQACVHIPCFVHTAFGQQVEIKLRAALFAKGALRPVG